jgi:hypothetical protein
VFDLSFCGKSGLVPRMTSGKTVLAQILDGLHIEQFQRCVRRHPMPRDTPALSPYDHFAAMVFAQLTYRGRSDRVRFCRL